MHTEPARNCCAQRRVTICLKQGSGRWNEACSVDPPFPRRQLEKQTPSNEKRASARECVCVRVRVRERSSGSPAQTTARAPASWLPEPAAACRCAQERRPRRRRSSANDETDFGARPISLKS
eukprot:5242470-Pleurochrysis_carterae.AAC.1